MHAYHTYFRTYLTFIVEPNRNSVSENERLLKFLLLSFVVFSSFQEDSSYEERFLKERLFF